MSDIDPAAVMADHTSVPYGPEADAPLVCNSDRCYDSSWGPMGWPCEPYRLAEALTAECVQSNERLDVARWMLDQVDTLRSSLDRFLFEQGQR